MRIVTGYQGRADGLLSSGGQHKGFAFLTFASQIDAQDAVRPPDLICFRSRPDQLEMHVTDRKLRSGEHPVVGSSKTSHADTIWRKNYFPGFPGRTLKLNLARPMKGGQAQALGNRAVWDNEEWIKEHALPLNQSVSHDRRIVKRSIC